MTQDQTDVATAQATIAKALTQISSALDLIGTDDSGATTPSGAPHDTAAKDNLAAAYFNFTEAQVQVNAIAADLNPPVTPPPVVTPPVVPPVTPPVTGSPLVAWYPGGAGNPSGQKALAAEYSPNLQLILCDGAVEDTWADVDNLMTWLGGQEGPAVMLPVPLCLTGQTLAQAESANAGVFTAAGNALIKAGVKASESIIRLGWEFSGNWYPWAASADPTNFVKCFQRGATELKALGFKIFWCAANRSAPYQGQTALTPANLYPGNAYVDIIGTDLYQETWVIDPDNTPSAANVAAAMNDIVNGAWGLAELIAFAESNGKPFGLGELGLDNRPDGHGLGDDPAFLPAIFKLIKACSTGVAVVEYFNGSDGADQSTLGSTFPNATAGAKAAFGTL